MPLIGGKLGYHLLRAVSKSEPKGMSGGAYSGRSKLETLLGKNIWQEISGKVVVDFGCGAGAEAIEMAQRGASLVYGVDINQRWLTIADENARTAGCSNVAFSTAPSALADVIVSIDAFEHFADPAAVLKDMSEMLKPSGCVVAAFGPTWYHPLGGHLFSVFPWAHLVFSEKSLCQWRAHIRSDGATQFSEVEGGLNQMTIARFERLVAQSRFRIAQLDAVPIRAARKLHNRFTREIFTAVVRCKLVLRNSPVG